MLKLLTILTILPFTYTSNTPGGRNNPHRSPSTSPPAGGDENSDVVDLPTLGPGLGKRAGADGSSAWPSAYLLSLDEDEVISAHPVTHDFKRHNEWAKQIFGVPLPNSDEDREFLADLWAHEGCAEQSAVALFSRISLQLMSVGAPADLVQSAVDAASDELRHSQICFSLANAYSLNRNSTYGPSPLPPHEIILNGNLAEFIGNAARCGCVVESTSAFTLAMRYSIIPETQPFLKSLKEQMALDEARHVHLHWRNLKWALEVGGEEIRSVIEEEYKYLLQEEYESTQIDLFSSPLLDFGIVPDEEIVKYKSFVRNEVLAPFMGKLLDKDVKTVQQGDFHYGYIFDKMVGLVNGVVSPE